MNTIKFLVVFFSLGYSIYFGSILFDALYQIQNNRLQTYSEILDQWEKLKKRSMKRSKTKNVSLLQIVK